MYVCDRQRVDFLLPLNVTFLVNGNIFTYNGYTCVCFGSMDKMTGYWETSLASQYLSLALSNLQVKFPCSQWQLGASHHHNFVWFDCYLQSLNTCISQDYMTDGHVHPTPDTKQESDWIVTNLTEVDGRTMIEFTRKQNTSDTMDNVIGVSTLHCNGKTS